LVIIHAAWNGVTADSRNNLKEQLSNLELLSDLLIAARDAGCKKFIGLGSQAEYGKLSQIATEDQIMKPVNSYGIAKILSSELIAKFCSLNEIDWYWLRVFSIFGKNESDHWLIPSLVKKVVNGEMVLNFSTATQKYAYLHVDDFSKMIHLIIDKMPAPSTGIYNLSAKNAIPLKDIIEKIKVLCGNDQVELKFGRLPLRENQSIHLEGEMTKFFTKISEIQYADFETELKKTVNFYLHFFNTKLYNS
jgi:nucleoside-diphosphate-sugar epimerase